MGKRLQQVLEVVSVVFTLASLGAILASPILFDLAFKGRYEEARGILPLALVQCVWMSLFLLAQTYLFCMERGKQVAVILVFGLALNVVFNYPLIAVFGLAGSMTATTIAGGIILVMLLWCIGRSGQPLGWRTSLLCFAPLLLLLLGL
jgi:O-antigen/teichoic acid export membrane protein